MVSRPNPDNGASVMKYLLATLTAAVLALAVGGMAQADGPFPGGTVLPVAIHLPPIHLPAAPPPPPSLPRPR